MKCFVCKNEIIMGEIVINTDGDMACSEKCKSKFESDRAEFFEIVSSGADLKEWLKSSSVE